jgi:cytochrome c peroxidase
VTRTFVQVGKALAAYEATLRPAPTRFDQFVGELAAGDARAAANRLTPAEQRGLRLFISNERAACLNCHNSPLLSNGGFHDIGTNLGQQANTELGQMLGATLMAVAEFRCGGDHSDALAEQCELARFQGDEAAGHGRGAFKVPSLRGVARTAPFMHDGRFEDLTAVLRHYRSPPLPSVPGAHELRPLKLSDRDIDDLIRFLQTL